MEIAKNTLHRKSKSEENTTQNHSCTSKTIWNLAASSKRTQQIETLEAYEQKDWQA